MNASEACRCHDPHHRGQSRVVAGCRRSAARHTRPTSDRVREALFSSIESWCGSLSGLRFLDLYAGSGAVGLEAWSRGAGVVTLVEQDRRASGLIRDNARAVGFRGRRRRDRPASRRRCAASPRRRTTWPSSTRPTRSTPTTVDADLHAARPTTTGWCPGALVVVERSLAQRPARPSPTGFTDVRERRYGETTLWYGHAARPRRRDRGD